MPHPPISPGHVAVITGGASGIGLEFVNGLARQCDRPKQLLGVAEGRPRAGADVVDDAAQDRVLSPALVRGAE